VLASLYLPWQELPCGNVAGTPRLFGCSFDRVEGWSRVGDVAALASLLLIVSAGAACVWPRFRPRLPLGQSALLLAYFTFAVAAETRRESRQTAAQLRRASPGAGGIHFHVAYGLYVGVAGASIALLAAALISREALRLRPAPRQATAIPLAVGLLVSLLLPWEHVRLPNYAQISGLGIVDPAGAIAAVLAIRLLVVCWRRERRQLELIAIALGILLFVVAAITVGFGFVRDYGAWAGLAAAVLLALVALTGGASIRAPEPIALAVVASAVAGAVVVASLFLPWQTACYGRTAELSALGVSGRCISSNGLGLLGSVTAVLTIALVGALLVPTLRALQTVELAAALALVVATRGFQLQTGSEGGVQFGFGYGSYIGFAAVATLVALALARSRRATRGRKMALPALLAVALAVAYVAVVALPWWDVLPDGLWSTFWRDLAAVSWLTLASGLLGLRLIRLWAQQARGVSSHAEELVGLSLVLVALAILDAIPHRDPQLTWNVAVLLGLTVPLTVLAVIEERGGLSKAQIPALLRIDRL
jgi:hypothetical protein